MADQAIPVEAEFTLLKKQLVKIKRRGSVRYRCNLATLGRLFFPGSGTSEEAWAQNLSETGIGLCLNHPLEPGTVLVIHATLQGDGSWRVGCEFSRKLTGEEMDSLL